MEEGNLLGIYVQQWVESKNLADDVSLTLKPCTDISGLDLEIFALSNY